MGVPAFFRWLSKKYPSIVVNANEKKPQVVDGVTIPVDSTQPNPNGVEFDNLYLDMNGIIHPCCHPEDRAAPKNEDEMMILIFEYIDRLFSICRPRRVLYMAIDGIAPRAKMNQQRSRRFRAAKENTDKQALMDKVRSELEAQGIPLPPPKAATEHFDSNCITPGTPFMARLAQCLRYYIHERVNTDPAWANIQVILSDANVPGEGEHKIMDYIRKQRASPSHDPNTQHCLCGADADLIMLGLATHEPNFTIIREEFVPNSQRACELCGQYGHELKDCQGLAAPTQGEEECGPEQREKLFIFLRLCILREYLYRELQMPNLPFKFDFERAIDDWVFMCFFVGNDFLPHLPSLEIREGAIDRLIKLYKDAVYKTGGYLTEDGFVTLDRVQLILNELGKVEDQIFRKRRDDEKFYKGRRKKNRRRERARGQSAPGFGGRGRGHGRGGGMPTLGGMFAPQPINQPQRSFDPMDNPRHAAYDIRKSSLDRYSNNHERAKTANDTNVSAAKQLKALIKSGNNPEPTTGPELNSRKRRWETQSQQPEDSDSDPDPFDEVKLYESGWRERYYQSKFEVSADDLKFRAMVVRSYVEGLCWVLRYYYQGCASWKWFFPFHYAPFASDFTGLADMKIEFEENTQPFRPLEQLMAVFPAASRKHLPVPWQQLMTDTSSSIIDFYPEDFKIDLNGKKFAWQGVALLPFVEEGRLLRSLQSVYGKLTEPETERNCRGCDRLFVGRKHPAFAFLMQVYEDWEEDERDRPAIMFNAELANGMAGLVKPDKYLVMPGDTLQSPFPDKTQAPDLKDNGTLCIQYSDPQFPAGTKYSAKRLEGAVDPPASLKPEDWNHNQGNRPYIVQQGFNNRGGGHANLSPAGHRMIDHHSPGRGGRGGGGGGRGGGGGGRGHHQQQQYNQSQSYGNNRQYNNNNNNNQQYYNGAQYNTNSYGNQGHGQQAYGGQQQAWYGQQQQQYNGPRPGFYNPPNDRGRGGQGQGPYGNHTQRGRPSARDYF